MNRERLAVQTSLFGGGVASSFDAAFAGLRRTSLTEGAWLDVQRGWVSGHEALFEQLLAETAWQSEERRMYDRDVAVPRQLALIPAGARPPLLEQMRTALSLRYGEVFERVSMALYRDGRDSVAWHGDTTARDLPEACVATVSVGAPRKFLLKPAAGGASLALSLGWGDLVVMGGTCQRTFRHCVPKVARAPARIAIMFRPVWAA